jgi:tRNA nucleotidyltransferase (CCA-adding enzyme)
MDSNIAARLNASLSAAERELVEHIARAAADLGLPLYVVGGLPRDLLLGTEGNDFDLVVEGDAQALAHTMAKRYGGKVTVHSKFGTAKWSLHGARLELARIPDHASPAAWQALDFVSARSETYKHAAALPTVKLGSIEDDMRRRDFSINALAIRLDGEHYGELRDDLGGMHDLENGRLRVLHNGSFLDDPTRMYRAVRYEQRYDFKIEPGTLALIPGGRAVIDKLSPQRIRHELDLILGEPRAVAMLLRLQELALLRPIHPSLSFDRPARTRLNSYEMRPPIALPHWPRSDVLWTLWLMQLPRRQIDSINKRLHFHAGLMRTMLAASGLFDELEQAHGLVHPSHWVDKLDKVPLMAVFAVWLGLPPGRSKTALERYLAEWRHLKPHTTGHDLTRLGLKPGAAYQKILKRLRDAWLDGEVRSEADEKTYLSALLAKR